MLSLKGISKLWDKYEWFWHYFLKCLICNSQKISFLLIRAHLTSVIPLAREFCKPDTSVSARRRRESAQTCNRKSSCKRTRIVHMREVALTRVVSSESEPTKGMKGGRKVATTISTATITTTDAASRLIDGDGFVSRSESVAARRGLFVLLSKATTTTTWIICCRSAYSAANTRMRVGDARFGWRRPSVRGTCPAVKCEAEVDGDEKDEGGRLSWRQGHVPRFAEMTERSTVSAWRVVLTSLSDVLDAKKLERREALP